MNDNVDIDMADVLNRNMFLLYHSNLVYDTNHCQHDYDVAMNDHYMSFILWLKCNSIDLHPCISLGFHHQCR